MMEVVFLVACRLRDRYFCLLPCRMFPFLPLSRPPWLALLPSPPLLRCLPLLRRPCLCAGELGWLFCGYASCPSVSSVGCVCFFGDL